MIQIRSLGSVLSPGFLSETPLTVTHEYTKVIHGTQAEPDDTSPGIRFPCLAHSRPSPGSYGTQGFHPVFLDYKRCIFWDLAITQSSWEPWWETCIPRELFAFTIPHAYA